MKRSKHTHARTHKEIDFTLQLVLLILAVSFNPNLVRGGVILPHPVGFPLITQKQ